MILTGKSESSTTPMHWNCSFSLTKWRQERLAPSIQSESPARARLMGRPPTGDFRVLSWDVRRSISRISWLSPCSRSVLRESHRVFLVLEFRSSSVPSTFKVSGIFDDRTQLTAFFLKFFCGAEHRLTFSTYVSSHQTRSSLSQGPSIQVLSRSSERRIFRSGSSKTLMRWWFARG